MPNPPWSLHNIIKLAMRTVDGSMLHDSCSNYALHAVRAQRKMPNLPHIHAGVHVIRMPTPHPNPNRKRSPPQRCQQRVNPLVDTAYAHRTIIKHSHQKSAVTSSATLPPTCLGLEQQKQKEHEYVYKSAAGTIRNTASATMASASATFVQQHLSSQML